MAERALEVREGRRYAEFRLVAKETLTECYSPRSVLLKRPLSLLGQPRCVNLQ